MCSRNNENDVEKSILYKFYDLKRRIGKGAYGVVWKAYKKSTNQPVAIKKVIDAFTGAEDAQRTYREVIYLKAFRGHPNIIQLLDIHKASNNKDLYLVFEFMEIDLHKYISDGNKLKGGQIRYILYQLLKALKYIHSGDVVHRDVKPSNILLNSDCSCKLADFGLARSLHEYSRPDPGGRLTEYVATRWYRAPEILLGSSNYSTAVDVWSLGCVLGEMALGGPLFPGQTSLHQLELLSRAAGCTREDVQAALFRTARVRVSLKWSLKEWLGEAGPVCVDMVARLLQVDPARRLTAAEALRHPFVVSSRSYRGQEPVLPGPVLPKYSDRTQLSVHDYRTALYSYDHTTRFQRRPLRRGKPATDPETTRIYHFPNKSVELVQQVSYNRGNSQSKFR